MPTLKCASKSRPSGEWSDDDYDVWDGNAKVVGRIFRADAAPPGRSWFWTITVRLPQYPTVHGYTATREEASGHALDIIECP